MSHKAIIVVPTTDESESETAVGIVQQRFCDAFGGFSQYRGEGGWVSDGETVDEPHTRIEATADASEEAVREVLKSVAVEVKQTLDEDAVYCEVTETNQFLV